MKFEHKLVINRKHTTIVEMIVSAAYVLNQLKSVVSQWRKADQCILLMTSSASAYVMEPLTRTEQNVRLLDLLVTFGEHGFMIFMEALRESGHHDLAQVLLGKLV